MGRQSRKKINKTVSAPVQTQVSKWCEIILEAGWLGLIVLVPAYFNTQTKQIFELDKIMLFRGVVEFMAAVYIVKVLEDGTKPRPGMKSAWPVYLLGGVLVITTLFSYVPHTSFWGSYFRSMGLFTFLHYFLLFFVVQDQLKTTQQIRRLVVAIVASTAIPMLYAVVQRIGLDPLSWGDMSFGNRVFSTFGQPNFLGGYLAMVLPFSLVAFLSCQNNKIKYALALYGLGQGLVIFWTASRGAMIGAAIGVFSFLTFLAYWKREKKYLLLPGGGSIGRDGMYQFAIGRQSSAKYSPPGNKT